MKLLDFENWLNTYLEVGRFKDYCPKGMLVEGKSEVLRGWTVVSLTLEVARAAAEAGVDFVIAHHPHGFWDNQSKVLRGPHKAKVQALLNAEISAFGYHLPLDAHPVVGNNAVLGRSLGLESTGAFSRHAGVDLGWLGQWSEPRDTWEVLEQIASLIGPVHHHFAGGPAKIQRVGICTGAAPSAVEELIDLGLADLYLTGEARENTQSLCLEGGIHFVAAGHHATEIFGPRALAEQIRIDCGLDVQFVNFPNSV